MKLGQNTDVLSLVTTSMSEPWLGLAESFCTELLDPEVISGQYDLSGRSRTRMPYA